MDKGKQEKPKKSTDNRADTAEPEESLQTGNVAMGKDLEDNATGETKEKKWDEYAIAGIDTAKLQELFDTMSAMAAVNLPAETPQGSTSKDSQEKGEDKAKPTLNAARLQEMLHTANVFSALDLPPELREKVEETKYLGEELLAAMNGFMEVGDEMEQRKKQDKPPKEDDEN